MGNFSNSYLRINQGSMGDIHYFNRGKRESYGCGENAVYPVDFGLRVPHFKRVIKMAQVKWAIILADIFGIPISLLGIVANMDNIKSAIIAILAIAYLCCRMFYYVVQKKQAIRDKEYDLWNREQDKIERMEKRKKDVA